MSCLKIVALELFMGFIEFLSITPSFILIFCVKFGVPGLYKLLLSICDS